MRIAGGLSWFKKCLAGGVYFLFVISPGISLAGEVSRQAEVVLTQDPSKKVTGLEWRLPQNPEVQIRENGEIFLVVKGSFVRPDYNALINGIVIPQNDLKDFSKEVTFNSDSLEVEFYSVSPAGKAEVEYLKINLPQYALLKTEFSNTRTDKKWNVTASVGPTLFQYTQTGAPHSDQTEITLRASGRYRLNEHWELDAGTFFNILNLVTNQDDPLRFFGINGRIGYVFRLSESRWNFTLSGGFYYLTTFANSIGFENMKGPEIFPVANYKISETRSAFGYFKFAPIAQDLSLLSLSNREIAVGGGYTFPWKGHSFTAGLDIAFLSLAFENLILANTSESIMFGIGF